MACQEREGKENRDVRAEFLRPPFLTGHEQGRRPFFPHVKKKADDLQSGAIELPSRVEA